MATYHQASAGYGIITLRNYSVTYKGSRKNAPLFTESTETFHAHGIIDVSWVSRIELL